MFPSRACPHDGSRVLHPRAVFWISDFAAERSCAVTITECIPWRKKGGQALFEINGLEDIESAMSDVGQGRRS